MREHKTFGKRTKHQKLPGDKVIKDIFGVVNKGCDSKQVTDFIKRATGHEIKLEEKTMEVQEKIKRGI
jgi:hypothetical protein